MSLSAGGGDWVQPSGDWLHSNDSQLDTKYSSSILLQHEYPLNLAEAPTESQPAPAVVAAGGACSSSSRATSRGRREDPAHAAPAILAARPLLVERSRLPIAGNSGMAWRRSQVSPASHASVVAGAIASGWSPPKAKASTPTRARAEGEATLDHALVASMASRLSQVEKLNQQQSVKLAKQSEELEALRAELIQRRLRDSVSSGRGGTSETIESLRAERDAYQQQVEEMTQFLADYGLTWVGDEPCEEDVELDGCERGAEAQEHVLDRIDANMEKFGNSKSASVAEKLGRPAILEGLALDINVIESRVHSLNAMVEKESAHIVSRRVGGAMHARLVADDASPLPLSFFRDGLKLGAHAFMAFDMGPAQQLIRDILDGYFPYALKDDHPDGVAMKVVDRTGYTFADWLERHAQNDADLTDSGNRLVPTGVHALKRAAVGADFLGRLPDKIVRDGRICDIHGPVGQQLKGGAVAGTSAPDAENEVIMLLPGREPSAATARLQVKLIGGERVVFHMEPSHTIGDLEEALLHWMANSGMAESGEAHLQLRTAFPRKVYSERSQTLAEAGLVPSAALFVGTSDTSEA